MPARLPCRPLLLALAAATVLLGGCEGGPGFASISFGGYDAAPYVGAYGDDGPFGMMPGYGGVWTGFPAFGWGDGGGDWHGHWGEDD
jgi:hypothetical protein